MKKMASEQERNDPDESEELDVEQLGFEWHRVKAAANLKKHRVSFDEAMTVFEDKEHLEIPDLDHSYDEPRFFAIGKSREGRLLTLVFTERGAKLRLISARRSEPWERTLYEAGDE